MQGGSVGRRARVRFRPRCRRGRGSVVEQLERDCRPHRVRGTRAEGACGRDAEARPQHAAATARVSATRLYRWRAARAARGSRRAPPREIAVLPEERRDETSAFVVRHRLRSPVPTRTLTRALGAARLLVDDQPVVDAGRLVGGHPDAERERLVAAPAPRRTSARRGFSGSTARRACTTSVRRRRIGNQVERDLRRLRRKSRPRAPRVRLRLFAPRRGGSASRLAWPALAWSSGGSPRRAPLSSSRARALEPDARKSRLMRHRAGESCTSRGDRLGSERAVRSGERRALPLLDVLVHDAVASSTDRDTASPSDPAPARSRDGLRRAVPVGCAPRRGAEEGDRLRNGCVRSVGSSNCVLCSRMAFSWVRRSHDVFERWRLRVACAASRPDMTAASTQPALKPQSVQSPQWSGVSYVRSSRRDAISRAAGQESV